ncbi:carbamoyltransferase HypF [Salipiger aestuarii]|uniref:carbamoyltransferase HypF n=1 Tax=Salipiger aestuarii TaxID=568098 RepID=UPI00123B5AA8|nr:carbamoyltransferase HypF [Salipiger aestuarii]KAA8616233.1 carbamoyltransferase [Salipiger aestuarii]
MVTGRRIRVRGQVQGVGFRPFVWRLAARFGVSGEVSNDAEGVLVLGFGRDLDGFERALRTEAPPLARVDAVESSGCDVARRDGFAIVASGGPGAETQVTPDAATCAECLDEVRGVGRRAGYAFANCTHCGPRFTIVTGLPYDRAQTTMAPFGLCDACRAEYENPADRRFHAQPVACPECGPRAWYEGSGAGAGNAVTRAADALLRGEIVAVKGLGGFHLACDATNAQAVALLRTRKRRPAKPFALMAPLAVVARHCGVSRQEEAVLSGPAAPIVLLVKAGAALPDAVAPGQGTLGWMLPATPLHHLLCDAAERPLVMTSGNVSGAPQVIGNDEARATLGAFADGFLMHDRAIARRLDDSVERVDPPMVLRRGRGRVPGTLALPDGFSDRQVVAYGGQMKAAICLIKNGRALLGHHLGELDEPLTWEAFLQADRDYAALFDHRPAAVACDLHEGYRATQHAGGLGLPVMGVQHHHAHLAACLGDNLWPLDGGPVAGIVLDGAGLGTDGTIWGGELLLGDYRGVERRAWLAPAPLAGGDAAAREPWRNAAVRLAAAGLDPADRFHGKPVAMLLDAARRGINAPLSSSAGRLFDAAAACLGLCPDVQSYEGEAAMRLEAMAVRCEGAAAFGDGCRIGVDAVFRELMSDAIPAPHRAWRFHAGLAQAFASRARALVAAGEARAVALTGGCFQNALLLRLTLGALDGVPVLIHRQTPANDGGLALGQALVALAQMESA